MWTVKDLEQIFQHRRLGVQGAKGEFAVLVPLVEKNGELCLLFERRADTLKGHQPGEVCFPGGRMEPGETPWQTALRETWEEIGIPLDQVRLIAPLDVVQEINGRVIYPFLGQVAESALEKLVLCGGEVQEVFTVPLNFFRQTQPYVYTCPVMIQADGDFPYERVQSPGGYAWRNGSLDVPIYEYEGRVIWGMTGRTVRWLVQRLEEGL